MIDPRGRSPWAAGELPSRASPRRRQGPPSALLVERLLRANRKTLVGRPFHAALRQTAGRSGRPRPLVVLLLAVCSALLAAAAFSAAASVFAAGGVAAMVVAEPPARQRAARLATKTGYAGEFTRDAALLDAYLAKVSGDLPPAALGARRDQGNARAGDRGAGRHGCDRHRGRRNVFHPGDGGALSARCLPSLRRGGACGRHWRARGGLHHRAIALPFNSISCTPVCSECWPESPLARHRRSPTTRLSSGARSKRRTGALPDQERTSAPFSFPSRRSPGSAARYRRRPRSNPLPACRAPVSRR